MQNIVLHHPDWTDGILRLGFSHEQSASECSLVIRGTAELSNLTQHQVSLKWPLKMA